MSIKDRLVMKTAGLVQAAREASSASEAGAKQDNSANKLVKGEARVPRTGPGQMLAFRSHMQENSEKVQQLEMRLKEFDGSLPVKKLDPNTVVPSKWANRHASSYSNSEFLELKKEIEAACGNVQPILVRPVAKIVGKFEIVFGHRRHQACLQLGLPVLAVIEDVSDRELFTAMDRENRSRADLSPYEQGEMYRRALDDGLFASLRMLASEVGADPGNLSKAISIARLPPVVLAAFPSPTAIQFRWGQALQKSIENDPDGVLKRAVALEASQQRPSASEVFDILTGQVRKLRAATVDLRKGGKSLGRIKRSTDGSVTISLKPGVLSESDFQQIRESIEKIVLQ